MITVLLTLVYVVVCVFLILVVLLQTGKRADLAGAFGGGGSQTAFGTRGAATLLAKATTGAAIAFMILALVLALRTGSSAGRGGSILDQVPETEAPAATDEAPPPGDTPEAESAPPPAEPPRGDAAEPPAASEGSEPPAGDAGAP